MHKWIVLSGVSGSDMIDGEFERNLHYLHLDESNMAQANTRGLRLAFLGNARRAQNFLACVGKWLSNGMDHNRIIHTLMYMYIVSIPHVLVC